MCYPWRSLNLLSHPVFLCNLTCAFFVLCVPCMSLPHRPLFLGMTVMGSEAAKWDKISISELCVHVASASYIACSREAGHEKHCISKGNQYSKGQSKRSAATFVFFLLNAKLFQSISVWILWLGSYFSQDLISTSPHSLREWTDSKTQAGRLGESKKRAQVPLMVSPRCM